MLEDVQSSMEQFLVLPVWEWQWGLLLAAEPKLRLSLPRGAIQVSSVQTAWVSFSAKCGALKMLRLARVFIMFSFYEYCSLLPIAF